MSLMASNGSKTRLFYEPAPAESMRNRHTIDFNGK
jgi:hypothetical protein